MLWCLDNPYPLSCCGAGQPLSSLMLWCLDNPYPLSCCGAGQPLSSLMLWCLDNPYPLSCCGAWTTPILSHVVVPGQPLSSLMLWCLDNPYPLSCCGAWTIPILSHVVVPGQPLSSLINSISKVFMHVLNNRFYLWCEENSVIDESQAGFRRSYSTIDHIFTLVSVVQKYLSKTRGRLYCVFIDFSKALDSVQHQILWNSLQNKSINGRFLTVLCSTITLLKT